MNIVQNTSTAPKKNTDGFGGVKVVEMGHVGGVACHVGVCATVARSVAKGATVSQINKHGRLWCWKSL